MYKIITSPVSFNDYIFKSFAVHQLNNTEGHQRWPRKCYNSSIIIFRPFYNPCIHKKKMFWNGIISFLPISSSQTTFTPPPDLDNIAHCLHNPTSISINYCKSRRTWLNKLFSFIKYKERNVNAKESIIFKLEECCNVLTFCIMSYM